MAKNLVIVESPAKAKTIGRYLGSDFQIEASVGHIRDLPSSTIGVDVNNHFKPRYITMKGKEKVIRELKTAASTADRVYIATDPDREGEAIAWHLSKILKIDETDTCRISFNAITKNDVRTAVESPRKLDMNLVHSQQARRILDRLVGYELSPLLWKKIKKGLSAGRVQSVATRMVVERERDIEAFKPEEYWLLTAFLNKQKHDKPFKARYHGEWIKGKVSKVKIKSKQETDDLLESLKDKDYIVHKVKKGKRQKQPGAPFITSTLQQEAARYLSFTSKRTMRVAQQLYEGLEIPGQGATALVTYIRTDSVRVSTEAELEARQYIQRVFGEEYLPKSPRRYKNRNKSQDAHEAIRPAHFDILPNDIREKVSHDQYRLYKLIWDKFMASQMAAAVVDTVTCDILAGTHIFRTSGETVKFPGYMAQYGLSLVDQDKDKSNSVDKPDKSIQLPELNEGIQLLLDHLDPEQKFTQPPARYTEASLIKAMEELGIGRPSTYAPTLSTIQDRLYIEKENRSLKPTELGKIVTNMLEQNFDNIINVQFTAKMEEDLDTVESGQQDWIDLLEKFYPPFHQLIEKASDTIEPVKIASVPTGEKCPDCKEGDLLIKEGRYGKFIACSTYPECQYTQNIETPVQGKCPLCSSGLVSRTSRKYRNSTFYTCDKKGSDPDCPFISWDMPIEGKSCETCGSYMVWKRFRGRSYPKCGNRDCPTNKKRPKKKTPDEKEQATDDKPAAEGQDKA